MLAERDGFALPTAPSGSSASVTSAGACKSAWKRWDQNAAVRSAARRRGDEGDFRSLDELVEQCDVLTSTPLYKEGPYKSLHLADEALIRRLKPGTILINACRGPVVDNAALLTCLEAGQP
jgi:erythronate-4-phosphate dehydrogenase